MILGDEMLSFKRLIAELLESSLENFGHISNQIEEYLIETNDNDLYFCNKVLSGTISDNLEEIIRKLKESDK